MENNKLKIAGTYLINSGIYLSTIKEEELNENIQVKDNITNFLMQTYLYLTSFQHEKSIVEEKNIAEEVFLTTKDVLNIYNPLFTKYGLNQAINSRGLPHIKRGNKFFFNKKEIDAWIADNREEEKNKTFKFV